MAEAPRQDRRICAPRGPIPTWYFALVVVRRGHRFCQVFPLERLGTEMSV